MSLKFGDDLALADIADDEAELAQFLETAREREATRDDATAMHRDMGYEGDFQADPDPQFRGTAPEDRLIPDGMFAASKGRGVSARTKKDIRAKTALLLTVGATAWQARDQFCGSVALESVPDVSEKLADIFCDSPSIVNWFTASGKFMKYLDLAMSLQQIAIAVFRHHVSHSADSDRADEDWSVYDAAG